MGKWIPCGEQFIVGDVIRWTEAMWLELKKKKKGKKRAIARGEQVPELKNARLSRGAREN